jgi:hypothetical protein
MPHTTQHHEEPRGPARGRTRPRAPYPTIALALFAVLATLLAGCTVGGSTFPGGYHCTAPQNPSGCYTQISFTHSHTNQDNNPDIAGDPKYAYSNLLVVPLSCDAACKASSGQGNPPGGMGNFLEMYQPNGGWYIRLGYSTAFGLSYYLQYRLPGVNNGQFTQVILGPAPTGNGGNTIDYKYALVAMGVLGQQTFFGTTGDWVAIIEPPYGPNGYLWEDLGPSTFSPTTVFYGQFVYGTSGAKAELAFFANNNILTAPYSAQNLQQFVTEDGSPPSDTQSVDHPTDASWLFKPTQSSTGGMFRIACCQGKPVG